MRKGSAAAAYYSSVWRLTLELTFHDQLPERVWPTAAAAGTR